MKTGLAVLIAVLALSGCKGEPKKDAGAGTAQGDVLPGAASDAMLPLDTVKSQAPLAPRTEAGDAVNVKPGKRGGVPSAAASTGAAEVMPLPSSSPSPAETSAAN